MTQAVEAQLSELLTGSPYLSYSYAYPHKTAYRPLTPAVSLTDAWRDEDVRSLLLYFHIPFCEYRCGFCNLFTLARPEGSLNTQYLAALRRQAEATRAAIDAAVRGLVGGAYERARRLLARHRAVLESGAAQLLTQETLERPELEALRALLDAPAAGAVTAVLAKNPSVGAG